MHTYRQTDTHTHTHTHTADRQTDRQTHITHICIYTHIKHTRTHTCTHTHTHTHTHTYCRQTNRQTHTHNTHVHKYVYIHTSNTHTRTHAHTHTHTHIKHSRMHAHTHTLQTDRQTQREREENLPYIAESVYTLNNIRHSSNLQVVFAQWPAFIQSGGPLANAVKHLKDLPHYQKPSTIAHHSISTRSRFLHNSVSLDC